MTFGDPGKRIKVDPVKAPEKEPAPAAPEKKPEKVPEPEKV